MINPKHMIDGLTVEDLCESAENYFKTLPNTTHVKAKPFSSLLEAPELLQNMGLLLSGLRLGKTMTVLDFGAGTCWFSRFLTQLQCRAIACDVSNTALEIGKQLFKELPIFGECISVPLFLHFNGHKIDLPDNSVDRIVCHDAFHHIPNQAEVLSEFARILRDGGIAGFSEPGKFHSQSPTSQFEMRHYNVLEDDIDVKEIYSIAIEKGFTDISCKLLNNMDVTLDEYNLLTGGVGTAIKHPRKLTMFPLAILNNIRKVMISKTIFFLYKGKFVPDSRSPVGLSHTLKAAKHDFLVSEGEAIELSLSISNTGSARWLNENVGGIGVVKIGTHLYDQNQKMLDNDFSRHDFETSVAPNETVDKTITLRFDTKGQFILAIDLVSEAVSWFELMGSQPQFISVQVK